MIFQVVVRMLKTNNCDDVRSSPEDEVDSEDERVKLNGRNKINGLHNSEH